MSFAELWESLLPIGRDPATGGYRRFSWTSADLDCRDWFTTAAAERGLAVRTDRNGNLWAWWQNEQCRGRAVVTGSHLDSVPDGGAFDGPLGVVSAFAAIDALRDRGFRPARPVAVAAFTEEEGARFGVACLGSRLLAGAIAPEAARGLRDAGGVSLAEAMTTVGADPGMLGHDAELLGSIAAFVELHIEQGRHLAGPDASAGAGAGAVIGIAEAIWPHGRWRFDFHGQADHAGTTALCDRHDPMLAFAATVLAAREVAARQNALSTVGKVAVLPGGVNAIPSLVRAWLDARGPDEASLRSVVAEISAAADRAACEHHVTITTACESFTARVEFDRDMQGRLADALSRHAIKAPLVPTGAGHDAGVLATCVPTGMLFVRNPSGISHAPGERAEMTDCETGVAALAAVIEELAAV